jgi:hypothetical protein
VTLLRCSTDEERKKPIMKPIKRRFVSLVAVMAFAFLAATTSHRTASAALVADRSAPASTTGQTQFWPLYIGFIAAAAAFAAAKLFDIGEAQGRADEKKRQEAKPPIIAGLGRAASLALLD